MNAHTDNTLPGLRASTALAQHNNYWLAIRQAGKEARLSLTDAIAAFVKYEDAEGGSTAPERAFSNFTRTIKAQLGLSNKQADDMESSRDRLDVIVLDALRLIEGSCAEIIWEGMEKQRSRREIKDAVKAFAKDVAGSISGVRKRSYFEGKKVQ
ncbi:hypothetical protein D2T31_12070 [Sinirhodobacter populi]|uniref:Uncharacterized protein n=1 Tax=Paenirhodobacter populi TaxID=2306993 RepID=A0A443K7Y9_9RHOB|nr:hypothetical protein [Sinirhodobacter populi]RWR28842.1 hypothetical protein D2T31_12070 [Sinirhodobacter populi]